MHNMSILALNAYEVFSLYEIVNKQTEKINTDIKNMEIHNQTIEQRT